MAGLTDSHSIKMDRRAGRLITALSQNGFKALIAGGAVRDRLLGEIPSDVDIVTDASLTSLLKIFKNQNVKQVGKSFHVCLVNGIEISSGRGCIGRVGFPEADLAKRDFTINAMAFDPVDKILTDPFSGRQDLENRLIRFTGDPEKRIMEDPLRMVRACRFVAKIDGDLAGSARAAIKKYSDLIKGGVASERLRLEIMKAMILKRPSGFFNALFETGLLTMILPSLARCHALDGGPHHNESVFEHSMMVGDALGPKDPVFRLAGYLHDAGKYDAARIKDGRLTFPGHEKETKPILSDLERLTFSRREIDYIESVILVHMRPLGKETTDRAVRRILALLEARGLAYSRFLRLRIADRKGNLAKQPYTLTELRVLVGKIRGQLYGNAGTAFGIKDLAITGRDVMAILNIDQGPPVGEALRFLFEKVLDDPSLNAPSKLKALLIRPW